MKQETKNDKLILTIEGAQQIDLEKLGAEVLHNVMMPLTDFIQNLNAAKNEANANMRAAVDTYKNDLVLRQGSLKRKIESLKDSIEESEQRSCEAVEALGAAISSDDTQSEEAAKKAVDEASLAEYMARRRLDALSKAKITGNDELFYSAIKAYSNLHERLYTSATVCSTLMAFLDECIEQLKQIRKSSESFDENWRAERTAVRKMWPMIEAHSGAVDFSNAHAGDEHDCKARYLEALVRRELDPAFIDSPAGSRLAKDIDMIIEHDERAKA